MIVRWIFGWMLLASSLFGQAVNVSVSLDRPVTLLGETNVLHVFAQVDAAISNESERIFSYYINLENTDGTIASLQATGMLVPVADSDPRISSPGTITGDDVHGIFNTFTNTPGAGVATPVELFRIPLVGLVPGVVTLSVGQGSGVSGLVHDFQVAPTNSTAPAFTNGNYSVATIDLRVVDPDDIRILSSAASTAGMEIQWPDLPGSEIAVQFSTNLADTNSWTDLPGAPHGGGTLLSPIAEDIRYYRLDVAFP